MKWVISVGGSMISPEPGKINLEFLKLFNDLIREQVEKGHTFILVTGGGAICRTYQQALKELNHADDASLDWLGISTTRVHATFLKLMFNELASDIVLDPTKPLVDKPIILSGGWKPGWSTDYVSVKFLENSKADGIINLTDVDHVYDQDPRTHPDAKPIKQMNWSDFVGLVGGDWKPGLKLPFDPIACKLASELGLKLIITDGNNLDALRDHLEGKEAVGTIISNQ